MRKSYLYSVLATAFAALIGITGIAMAQSVPTSTMSQYSAPASSAVATTTGPSTMPGNTRPINNIAPASIYGTSTQMNSSSINNSNTQTNTGSSSQNGSVNNTSINTPPTIRVIVYPAPGMTPASMVLHVSDMGTALIRGTVQSIGTSSITIQSWGGTWTINTGTGSTVVPQGVNDTNDFSALHVGDFVGVIGTISSTQPYAINASFVRDWTTNPYRVTFGVTPATTSTSSTTTTHSNATTTY